MEQMNDCCYKFAEARKLLPGMSREFYALTDYISSMCRNQLLPWDVVMLALDIWHNIELNRDMTPKVRILKKSIKNEVQLIPMFIDAIAEEEFASEVRRLWVKKIGLFPHKKVDVSAVKLYMFPTFVNVAVDWWASIVLHPTFLMEEETTNPIFDLPPITVRKIRQFSTEEIRTFKEALSQTILEEISRRGRCCLSVDRLPDKKLSKAAFKVGVDRRSFPMKAFMAITENKITASEEFGPSHLVWHA